MDSYSTSLHIVHYLGLSQTCLLSEDSVMKKESNISTSTSPKGIYSFTIAINGTYFPSNKRFYSVEEAETAMTDYIEVCNSNGWKLDAAFTHIA